MAPDAAPTTAAPELVTISRGEITRALSSPLLVPGAAAALGASLQLTGEQISALQGGAADLKLTPEQYTNLKKSVMDLRKRAEAEKGEKGGKKVEGNDATGSLCGSSGTPAAAATPKTVPSVTTTASNVTETNAGTTTTDKAKVGLGTVTVRTDVAGTFGGSNDHLFALTYKGSDAKDNHWLQFIHREILGIHADNSVHAQTGAVTTTGGTYNLTTGGTVSANGTPAKANYNTDTADSSNPFYEAGGINNRTADASTMYDAPGAINARVQAAFAAGAKRVISRAHFDTFLITSDHVVYKVQISVVYDFASAAATPAPVTTQDSAGAAAALAPAALAEKFHDQYASFAFIK